MSKKIVSSAPGKVLITGGYVILDQVNEGLVLTLSARFYSTAQYFTQEKAIAEENSLKFNIRMESPQFGVETIYQCELFSNIDGEDVSYPDCLLITPTNQNTFVETVLRIGIPTIINYFSHINDIKGYKLQIEEILGHGLNIELKADNSFYSQHELLTKKGMKLSLGSLKKLPKFSKVDSNFDNLRKTGLGSSACLVSSLVGAIFGHFQSHLNNDLNDNQKSNVNELSQEQLFFLHNLSQFIHCLAQGKLGSGFDVSSAIFGSQTYKRFSPSVITILMENISNIFSHNLNLSERETTFNNWRDKIRELKELCVSNDKWDSLHSKFQLPKGMTIILGDVNSGSSTPSMVRNVLLWKKERGEYAEKFWEDLHKENLTIKQNFARISEYLRQKPEKYLNILEYLSSSSYDDWVKNEKKGKLLGYILNIYDGFISIRKKLKLMGIEANTSIEPDSQTSVIDQTIKQKGVIASGVPGAGGSDAIFALVIDKPDVIKNLSKFWRNGSPENPILTLDCAEDFNGLAIIEDINN